MRPLPDVPSDPALEPRLELVPDVEEAEETEPYVWVWVRIRLI